MAVWDGADVVWCSSEHDRHWRGVHHGVMAEQKPPVPPAPRVPLDIVEEWVAVDALLETMLHVPDRALDAALAHNAQQGLPAIDVSATQGKLLMLLCRLAGARRVLEIGTLGGYSTIWLARGIAGGGTVVTLEVNPHHADAARSNVMRAGLADRVDLRVGSALDTLPLLLDDSAAPFDVVFIDADKPNNPAYLQWALRLSRPGTLLVLDNVVRDGSILNADSIDDRVVGTRNALALLGEDPRIDATAIQTVGSKGWDGLAIGVVTSTR
jgi:predicted O-methyltransferase YrrM